MSGLDQFLDDFRAAQSLHAAGRLQEAEAAYRRLLDEGNQASQVLWAMARLYVQRGRREEAIDCLEELEGLEPGNLPCCDNLANLYLELGDEAAAISCYRRFIDRNPSIADAHYNLALIQRKTGSLEEALASYGQALRLGIEQPEEVHSNISIIYSELRREDEAIDSLETALKLNPAYVPALFNLANRKEEAGDREAAQALFQAVLTHDPKNYEALARLADIRRFQDPNDELIRGMKRAARKFTVDPQTRMDLYFGLGKALDECGAYDDAFGNYGKANELARQTMAPYDRKAHETLIEQLMATFSEQWFQTLPPVSEASPIFICGMFRSGSTLIEQVLAGHPQITAGGEVDFFVREVHNSLQPFPAAVSRLSHTELGKLAEAYLAHLEKTFPDAGQTTDKRPDNFLYLGLIRSLFPNARIICTLRDPLDNCLSVYFQQLGPAMNYATSLEDTAHYFLQHRRLMAYWQARFGANLFMLNYDDFVREPRPILEALLEFCGLDWCEDCLEFYKTDNFVKTASVWQVRQPLYQRSSGRWRNYESHLGPLREYLQDGIAGIKS